MFLNSILLMDLKWSFKFSAAHSLSFNFSGYHQDLNQYRAHAMINLINLRLRMIYQNENRQGLNHGYLIFLLVLLKVKIKGQKTMFGEEHILTACFIFARTFI